MPTETCGHCSVYGWLGSGSPRRPPAPTASPESAASPPPPPSSVAEASCRVPDCGRSQFFPLLVPNYTNKNNHMVFQALKLFLIIFFYSSHFGSVGYYRQFNFHSPLSESVCKTVAKHICLSDSLETDPARKNHPELEFGTEPKGCRVRQH